KIQVTAIF
ncbi:glycosyl hydrolase 1 family protein, partial [Vibrio parahaemolyticus V-223/04]